MSDALFDDDSDSELPPSSSDDAATKPLQQLAPTSTAATSNDVDNNDQDEDDEDDDEGNRPDDSADTPTPTSPLHDFPPTCEQYLERQGYFRKKMRRKADEMSDASADDIDRQWNAIWLPTMSTV